MNIINEPFLRTLTQEELRLRIGHKGLHISPEIPQSDGTIKKDTIIFLAVRNDYVQEAEFQFRQFVEGAGYRLVGDNYISAAAPIVEHSHPDPSLLSRVDNPNAEYLIAGSTAGTVLRHELKHFVADHPTTDILLLQDLLKAFDQYQKGDDSGYYYVFETPEGNVLTLNVDEQQRINPAARSHNIKGHSIQAFKARAAARARV